MITSKVSSDIELLQEWSGVFGDAIDITIKGGKRLRGVCYYNGSSYHGNSKPFINIHIPKYLTYPYKMYRSHGLKRIPDPPIFESREELLVYFIGHEIAHYWWRKSNMKNSEVNCEINAHAFLNQYRKEKNDNLFQLEKQYMKKVRRDQVVNNKEVINNG